MGVLVGRGVLVGGTVLVGIAGVTVTNWTTKVELGRITGVPWAILVAWALKVVARV
jgi:hypothetical protein